MKTSIIIPVYEAKGLGLTLLRTCLDSIRQQTFNNYEIIIPDHSINNKIEQGLIEYKDLNILHFFNSRGRGNASINMNEGIKKATGDIIKIMHFDDYFCNKTTLQFIHDKFNSTDLKWGLVGFNHLTNNELHRVIIPSRIRWGCPSVSFFINDKVDPIYFDENLIWINDHEIYTRLLKKYGDPVIIDNICVTIRMHENQVSNILPSSRLDEEWKYFHNKHSK